jgi:hypothetical protein
MLIRHLLPLQITTSALRHHVVNPRPAWEQQQQQSGQGLAALLLSTLLRWARYLLLRFSESSFKCH